LLLNFFGRGWKSCTASGWLGAASSSRKSCPPGERSTMRIFFSRPSPRSLKRSGMTTPPPIKSGISSRLTKNALVRTVALYSRAAIMNGLRMGDLLLGGTRDADEDVVQRGMDHLEVQHRAASHQRRQHVLRVAAVVQAQLLAATIIGDLDDARQIVQAAGVAVELYPQRVPAVLRLDGID